MPQHHYVETRDKALEASRYKIFHAPDNASAIIGAHLVIEALLYSFLRSKLVRPDMLKSANLRFKQILILAQAHQENQKAETWLWETIEKLNTIRNRLSHDIVVQELNEKIDELFTVAGHHIHSNPEAGSDKPISKDERLKWFLVILVGVVRVKFPSSSSD